MKKTFKHFICLFVAILCFGHVWATDYTIYQATSSGVNCANVTETGISVTFNSMKGISNSPITSVANTTYGIEAGLKAPRWGGSGDGKNIAIVVAENYTATITAYVQVNTASQTVTIKQTTESGDNVASVSCSATETVYQVQATDLAAGTYYIKASDKVGLIKLVVSVTAAGGGGGSATPTHSVTAATSTGTTTYGTVSAASTTVAEGSTTVITATPATGYRVASWAVSGTGASISPSGSSNSNTTTLTMGTADATVTVTFEEKPSCPTSGTVYSAAVKSTVSSAQSFAANSTTEVSSSQADITGGKLYAINGESSAKDLIASSTGYKFCMTNNTTKFKLELDCELAAGDVITIDGIGGTKNSDAKGLWVSSSQDRPSSAPACSGTSTTESLVDDLVNYTVTSSDEYHEKTVLYIHRAVGASTYFNNISITRPEKFDVTYYKNDGTDASSVATDVAVVADNAFTRSGYRFIEWNTQADGKGTKVNVGASVTANMLLYAIWAQEYSVSYANTGAASGAAPTNTNKYITGEKFNVAGVGSMVAAENYVFSGWNDGSKTYAADDEYTVGSADVSFAPVWMLSYNVTYNANGGTLPSGAVASAIVVNNPSTIAQCQFLPADGNVFTKWNTQADGKGVDYLPGASISTTIELYAQYATVTCDDRQTLTKAVMTSSSAATVTGYNEKEYAGEAKMNGLGGGSGTAVADLGDGDVTGYKLASQYSLLFATLAKGSFQAGDQLTIGITKPSGGSGQQLEIYAGSDKDNVLKVINLDNITEAGYYKYTLTTADASAINAAGYKSIGLYRSQGTGGQNPFVYSIELTGCRSWSIYHTLTFKNVDGTATIATENLAEGDLARTVAPSAPVIDDKYFAGWSESIDGTPVDMSAYTITEDKILYAVYEDCPTYGTIFKFTVATGLDNGNIFAQVPNLMELTTENYLAELENGTVTAAVISSNNDRIRYNDQRGLEFNGDSKGTITISMDCPMKTGDVVRVINYAASGNKLKLSANSLDVQVDGNGAETIQTVEVPAEWNNLRTLVLSRGAKNPKFTYIEIYRRPVLTSVTLEDMNLKVGKTGTPVMTLNPEDALVTSQAWEITTSTATGTTIDASTGLITAGETTGEITVKVTLNGDKEATCTVKVVAGFEAPRPVTETTIWDWEPVATATDGPSITAPDTVLANYLAGDEWEMLAGNSGGRPYRSTTYKAYQGTSLYFNAEVPGMLRIYAGSTGNDKKVYVNGIEVGTTGPKAYLNNIVVPAGDVYITSESMRIYWMKFDTDLSAYELTDNVLGGYERAVTEGRYGTICLPKAGVMVGAAIFEVAYLDNNDPYKKIFFDEVISGEMVAGRPYIFLPNEGVSTIGVFYTDDTEETAGNYRGLFGSYTQEVLATDGTNYILLNNQYCRVANLNTSVGANRAYFKIGVEGGVPTNAVAPAPGRRRVSMSAQGEQVATGMEEAQSDNLQCAKIVIDGHFFILRGEKMYDATGRLVK